MSPPVDIVRRSSCLRPIVASSSGEQNAYPAERRRCLRNVRLWDGSDKSRRPCFRPSRLSPPQP